MQTVINSNFVDMYNLLPAIFQEEDLAYSLLCLPKFHFFSINVFTMLTK